MVNSLLIISIVIAIAIQYTSQKIYSQKLNGKGVLCFSALACAVAAIFFMCQIKLPLNFDVALIPYCVLFALGFGSTVLFSVLAIANGPLSLTTLISSYSLIIPALYGLIFLNEKVSFFLIIGFLFLFVSLYLINYTKGDNKINLKWLLYVALTFFGNGLCSSTQKVQQINFSGGYKGEFMAVSLIIIVLALFIIILFKEKQDIKISVKKGIIPIVVYGLANGFVNLLVMVLSNKMSASVMFPLVSAGSITLTYIISRVIYKETLSKMQNIGFVLGLASIVFLNL
ncbi:MAG: hypothetical protein E7560_06185 [Ruminococcaceae bacterium]|nr:hypothetical protein [Oscillospiraceae bacterium]